MSKKAQQKFMQNPASLGMLLATISFLNDFDMPKKASVHIQVYFWGSNFTIKCQKWLFFTVSVKLHFAGAIFKQIKMKKKTISENF